MLLDTSRPSQDISTATAAWGQSSWQQVHLMHPFFWMEGLGESTMT
jgi:hypothetical protein